MTLMELIELLKKHLKLVIALPVACALVMAAYSTLFMPNEYTSSVSLYVLAKDSSSTSSTSTNYTDLTASQLMANDITKILESERMESDTASALQMQDLSDFDIDIASDTTSRVITLSVTGTSAQSAAIVANKMAEVADEIAREVMDVQSVNVIDQAKEATSPSGPSRGLYTAVALLAGLFLAVAIVVVLDMLNTRVRNADELEELLGVPVIGRIPVIR